MLNFRLIVVSAVLLLGGASFALAQTDEDTANRLLVDAVTGSGGALDPLYKRRLLSALAEEFRGTAAARSVASGAVSLSKLPEAPEWHQLLVAGSEITGFDHGEFPSYGDATHPGFDIGLPGQADCGVPVTSPLAGSVVRVVAEDVPDSELAQIGIDRARNDRDLDRNTGNAVILRHGDGSSVTYSIYLHLQSTPSSSDGLPWRVGMTIPAGAQIGKVGETGAAEGCHLHFEARNFEGTYKYLHPEFGNIYPSGDISGTETFAKDWVDPETFLRRAFLAMHLGTETPPATSAEDSPETKASDPQAENAAESAGIETTSEEAGDRELTAGDWIETREARRTVRPGETAGDISVAENGSVRYRGEMLFAAAHDPAATEVRLFFSPVAGSALVMQWDLDWGGLRAALINLGTQQVLNSDLVPETAVRGKAEAINVRQPMLPVAWSPDGKYAVIPLSPGEWQADLLLIDAENGNQVVLQTDDLQPGQWTFPKLETLRWEGDDWASINYDVLACADADCTAPAVVGSISGGHRVSTLLKPAPESSKEVSVEASEWGPSLVAGVEVGYYPCRAPANETDACLRALGLSKEAISFSFESDGDYSGSSVGTEFRELGAVDLATRQFIGNTFYYTPILLNGALGFQEVPFTRNLPGTFRDSTSQQMLQRFPRASNIGGIDIRSHRRLPDGTQRFTVVEIVNDGCRACEILGSAVSFLEIGPATGNRLERRPIGLLLGDPAEAVEMTAEVIRGRPESLQVSLNALGYDAGEMDGFPGPQTRRALMEFQVEHCLTPTGQPDPATANALLGADGFEAPCAGARLPERLDANTPLLSGIYVDDPALCSATSAPYETVHLQQRIVRGRSITWGHEGGCEIRRTDIRDGVTLFRGTCSEGNQSNESRWRFDVQSNESFIDLDMPTAIPRDAAPRRFTRCPDNSTLRSAFAPWFGDAAPGGAGAEVPGQQTVAGTAADDASRRAISKMEPVTFARNMTLNWGGTPQGIVGTLQVAGRLDESGLTLTVQSVNGRHNPSARANPVDRGAEIDFFINAVPRKNCEGCKPTDGSFRSATTMRLQNDVLSGPYGETTAFVPMSVLERNDLVSVGLVGTDNKIYLSDLTIDRARDLGIGVTAELPNSAIQSSNANTTVAVATTSDIEAKANPVDLPDFREIIDGLDSVGAADKAATAELLQTAFTLIGGMEPDGTAALLGISAKDFAAEFVLDPEGMLAVVGSDIVVSAGEAVFAEAAGDLVAGYMFASGPLSQLPNEWQVPLRAFVDATIVESVGLLATGTDPTGASLVGPIVDRLHDVYEIYQATNALSRTQASGLFAVANGAEITAELVRKHPGEKSEALKTDWFAMTRENLRDIVGADDASSSYNVTVIGYRALEALGRGDAASARAEIERMRAVGDATQGLTPLSAEGPIDLLVRLASGGNDAPMVLVETFLKSTALRSLHPASGSVATAETAGTPEAHGDSAYANVDSAQVSPLSVDVFEGVWVQSGQGWKWTFRFEELTAKVISGGDSARPINSEVLRIERLQGTDFSGSWRFRNGQWYEILGSVEGDTITIRTGRTTNGIDEWVWRRERSSEKDNSGAQTTSSSIIGSANAWARLPGIEKVLLEVVSTYPGTSLGGCAQAHGPISPELRMKLFDDANMTVVDQRGRTAVRPVTRQMIEGDRFCLNPNNAQCAASNYQLYYCASGEMLFVNPGGAFSGTFRVTDVVERPRNPIVSTVITSEIYGRNLPDIRSERTGCALSNGWSEPTGFRWNGACQNGRASGPGTIEWMRGPEVIWRTRVGPNWGIALSDGVLRYDIDLKAFDFSLSSCDQGISGFRSVNIKAPVGTPQTYFENSWVADELMRRGARYAQAECPVDRKGFSNIVVAIELNGEQVVRGRNYEKENLTWREFSNPAARAMQNELQQAERNRVASEQQRLAQARADALTAEFQHRRDGIIAQAENFVETGRGNIDDLAAALEIDHLGTLDRLERGATLRLGPVEGLATVTHDGERHYRVNHVTSSPFARLEREFRSKQDFSWENWMALTQSAMPDRTELSCLFERISTVPQEVRDVRVELLSFSQGSNSTVISFSCE